MSPNPRRRMIVVSAISGVLIFGAAGFAAAATGSGKQKSDDVTVTTVDASSRTDATSSTIDDDATSSTMDD